MRHPHADLIHAWAEGANIECYHEPTNVWAPTHNPTWGDNRKYRIKPKEPDWFENIPAHGVLCWVSMDTDTPRKHLMLIIKHIANNGYSFVDEWRKRWKCATPLTDDEIKQFLRGEQ